MEDAEKQPAPKPVAGDEAEAQQQRARAFAGERAADEVFGKHRCACVLAADALRQKPPLHKTHAPSEGYGEHGDNRHETHAARLNQQQDYDLARQGPVRRRVHDDQPRHAGCRRRGEQAVDKRRETTVCRTEGQHQNERADKDHAKIDQCGDACVRTPLFLIVRQRVGGKMMHHDDHLVFFCIWARFFSSRACRFSRSAANFSRPMPVCCASMQ